MGAKIRKIWHILPISRLYRLLPLLASTSQLDDSDDDGDYGDNDGDDGGDDYVGDDDDDDDFDDDYVDNDYKEQCDHDNDMGNVQRCKTCYTWKGGGLQNKNASSIIRSARLKSSLPGLVST